MTPKKKKAKRPTKKAKTKKRPVGRPKKPRPGRPKKKPARKKAPARPPVEPAHVDAAVILLVSMSGPVAIRETLAARFDLLGPELTAVLDAARARIIQAAGPDLVEMAGQAISRLDHIYEISIKKKDGGIALQAEREKISLLSLKQRLTEHAAGLASTDAEPAELAAIRGHLEPLGLAADAGPVELARLAALEVIKSRQ